MYISIIFTARESERKSDGAPHAARHKGTPGRGHARKKYLSSSEAELGHVRHKYPLTTKKKLNDHVPLQVFISG